MLTPFTFDAIFISHAGAEKMEAAGYRFVRDAKQPRKATIITPAGMRYTCNVGANTRYCGCPFYVGSFICKHTVWLSEKLDEEDAMDREAAAQAEYETTGRFDLETSEF